MLAAAATLWVMFWLWLTAPRLGVGRLTERLAGGLLFAEMVALLTWSYGNDACAAGTEACPVHARVAEVAATVDIPVLAGLLVILAIVRTFRHAAATTAEPSRAVLSDRARGAVRPTARGWVAGPRGSRR